MNRNEIIDLLEIVISAYPNTKISDPSAMATSWEMVLGEYEAQAIYKAARLHMATSPFFPKPADLIEKMVRAEMLYTDRPRPVLEPPKRAKVTAIPDGMTEEEFIDSVWNAVVETEREMYPDDPQPVDSDLLGRSLPYEN